MLALDLFCCGGGSSRGLANAGFRVVGVDRKPQKEYAHDFLERDLSTEAAIRAVIDEVRPDFISSSPPCQAFSAATPTRSRGNHADLIPATRAAILGAGIPGWIENVSGAPLHHPIRLCGTMFHATWRLKRHRWFDLLGWSILEPEHRWCVYGPREDVTWTDPLGVTATTAGSESRRVAVAGHGPPDAAASARYRTRDLVSVSVSVAGDGNRGKGPREKRDVICPNPGAHSERGNHRGGQWHAKGKALHEERRRSMTIAGNAGHGPGQTPGQNNAGKDAINWRTAMGWLDGPRSRYCLAQAVPPAYAEFLARRFLETRS